MRLALVWCILFATFFFKNKLFSQLHPPWPSALKFFWCTFPSPQKKTTRVCLSGWTRVKIWKYLLLRMASRKLDAWFWWFYGKFFTVLGKGGLLHLAVVWHLKTHHLKKLTKVASNLRRPRIKRFQNIHWQSLVNMLIDGTIFESHFSLSNPSPTACTPLLGWARAHILPFFSTIGSSWSSWLDCQDNLEYSRPQMPSKGV